MTPPNDSSADPSAPGSVTSEPVDIAVADAMPQSLHSAVYARRSEYVRPHQVRVKVGTWNVAACPGTDHDLAAWFVSGKGVDRRLSNVVAASSNGALQRETSNTSLSEQEGGGGGAATADIRVMGDDNIGIYALGLQEVVDLNVASQYMSRVYTDSSAPALDRWKTALELALPKGYKHIASEQMSGLLLLIYAAPEVAAMVNHVSTSAVGTGLLGLLGNKGSVSANIVLGESTRMVFVNCHLASGNDSSHADRRCWDISTIESRTQFEPYNHPGLPETKEPEKIGDADFAFWFGDLNFRLDDLPGDDIRRILTLHARGEYDLSQKKQLDGNGASGNRGGGHDSLAGEEAIVLKNPTSTNSRSSWASGTTKASTETSSTASTALTDEDDEDAAQGMKSMPPLPDPDEFLPDASEDPASLQATLDSLLPHDQLGRMIRERKAFHDGWREGRITFLPSYKYDVGTIGLFDSSEKRRAPSWCDRILYRTRKDKDDYEQLVKDKEEAKKRDEEMTQRGLDHAGDDDEVLFEYQPDADGDDRFRRGSTASNSDYDEYDDGEYNPDEDNEDVPQDAAVDRIHLDIYASHQRIQSSDHKPVVSLFTVDYDAVVPDLKAVVHAEVAKELDRTENESTPRVTIVLDSRVARPARNHPSDSDESVDFGLISFMQKASTSLTLANTGRVPAVFSFAEKVTTEDMNSSGLVAHPYQWLTTSFVRQDKEDTDEEGVLDLGKEVTLEPGETVSAILEVYVSDLILARMLNDGVSKLEDVLVLRVDEGRDHFIPVRGTWAPTCIGRSIEELVRVPDGGIRAFVASLTQDLEKKRGKKPVADSTTTALGSISYDLDVRCAAPKELFKLTETIENLVDRAIADEQMLEDCKIPSNKVGWPFEEPTQTPDDRHIVAVIDALDNDRPVLDAFEPEMPSLLRLEVISHVLLLFLRGLTDGVVTISLWSQIDQATLLSLNSYKNANPIVQDPNSETDKNTILDILSSTPHHNISFVFLTTTLSRIIGELSPLSLGDLDALRSIGRGSSAGGGFSAAIGGIGSIGRRSLSSFRKTGASPASAALEALERRIAREKRYAEILGAVMCRAPVVAKDRERRAQEDKQRAVVELFLRRSREELGGH